MHSSLRRKTCFESKCFKQNMIKQIFPTEVTRKGIPSFKLMSRRMSRFQSIIGVPFLRKPFSESAADSGGPTDKLLIYYSVAVFLFIEVVSGIAVFTEIANRYDKNTKKYMILHCIAYFYFASTALLTRLHQLLKAKTYSRIFTRCYKLQMSRRFDTKHNKALMRSCNIAIIFYLLTIFEVVAYFYSGIDVLVHSYAVDFLPSEVWNAIVGSITFAYSIYGFAGFIVIPNWVCILAEYFRLCFSTIKRDVKELNFRKIKPGVSERLKCLRQHYGAVCRLVDEADDLISPGLLFLFCGNLIHSCFCAFYIFQHANTLREKIVLPLSFFLAFIMMMFSAITGQRMINEAFGVNAELSTLHISDLSPQDRLEVLAFSSLCGTVNPSFTGSKFFQIDLKIMVSVLGTIVTYTIILLQSKNHLENNDLPSEHPTDQERDEG